MPRSAWAWWNAGFLAWGTAMALAGGLLVRGRGMLRAALPWILLALALTAATAPVRGRWVAGFDPTLDELPSLRCGPAQTPS